MKVAIIVLTWNAADAALACLQSIAEQQHAPDSTLVVDNASSDDTVERIGQAFPAVHVIRNERNMGFSVGMNVGIRSLQTQPDPPDIVALLNQDTVLDPQWLGAIVAPFERNPKVGATGSKIRYSDGTLQHAGISLDYPRGVVHHIGAKERDTGQYDTPGECDMVTGAAIALRMDALNKAGVFDPGYTPAYYEDVDLCWRLRFHGYQIYYAPEATLVHHESLSLRDERIRSNYYNRGRLRFVLKSYQLADILGPFAESEFAFIREHGHTLEERALRWAYIETAGRITDINRARNAFFPPLFPEETQSILAMLLACKREVMLSLYHRAYSTIDAFYVV